MTIEIAIGKNIPRTKLQSQDMLSSHKKPQLYLQKPSEPKKIVSKTKRIPTRNENREHFAKSTKLNLTNGKPLINLT